MEPTNAQSTEPLRIGVLGAAKICPSALIEPARRSGDVRVTAVAARDRRRAAAFAEEHGIVRAYDSYEQVVTDPNVDAIYNPLPNGMHGHYSIAALRAGKDVLCEKPFSANADEARRMVAAADDAGRVLMEAFHYFYHPLTQRWRDLLAAGAIGEPTRLRAQFRASIPRHDVRYRVEHAGGALMDLGCYCVHATRWALQEKLQVQSATAHEGPRGIDVKMDVELVTASGKTAHLGCDMGLASGFEASLSVEGTAGVLRVQNPFLPHLGHRFRVDGAVKVDEEVSGDTTYDYQLRAFIAAIRTRQTPATGGQDAIATMEVIDAAYAAAGLVPRQPTL
jgi:predicted dehydrogenase